VLLLTRLDTILVVATFGLRGGELHAGHDLGARDHHAVGVVQDVLPAALLRVALLVVVATVGQQREARYREKKTTRLQPRM
jgi:hypothetical protein